MRQLALPTIRCTTFLEKRLGLIASTMGAPLGIGRVCRVVVGITLSPNLVLKGYHANGSWHVFNASDFILHTVGLAPRCYVLLEL